MAKNPQTTNARDTSRLSDKAKNDLQRLFKSQGIQKPVKPIQTVNSSKRLKKSLANGNREHVTVVPNVVKSSERPGKNKVTETSGQSNGTLECGDFVKQIAKRKSKQSKFM